jgi:dipeptidyl aminopeptidase/acylaminoacyl peptidase
MAQAFDVKRLALKGDPMPLVENIDGGFSVSENGVLVYQRASDSVQQSATHLLWFDRQGKSAGQVTAPADINTIQLSPEGRRVAVTTDARSNGLSEVWVIDLSDGVKNKLNAEHPYFDGYAVWSPDGSRMIFSTGRAGYPPISMYQQFSNGNGKAELLLQNDSLEQDTPQDWHGDYILFRRLKVGARLERNLWVLPMSGDRTPKPYLPQSRFQMFQVQVSPNGQYLAYVTAESGTNQVVVQTFPNPTKGKWTISASGGIEPRWRNDGRELFYLEPDGKLIARSVKTESTFEFGDREVLFQIPFATGLPLRAHRYDVDADGKRFLVVPPPPGSGETSLATITAVVNWPALLRRK